MPMRVFVLAFSGIRERRYRDSFFLPISATTAVSLSAGLVAAANASACVQVPVSKIVLRSWEMALAIERCSEGGRNSAYLISSEVS